MDIIGFYILKSGSERGYRRSRYMHIIQPLLGKSRNENDMYYSTWNITDTAVPQYIFEELLYTS